jgi:hypothetical protein
MWGYVCVGLLVAFVVGPVSLALGGVLGQVKVRDHLLPLLRLADGLQQFLDQLPAAGDADSVVVSRESLDELRSHLRHTLDQLDDAGGL